MLSNVKCLIYFQCGGKGEGKHEIYSYILIKVHMTVLVTKGLRFWTKDRKKKGICLEYKIVKYELRLHWKTLLMS